jgi:hypothetical protein
MSQATTSSDLLGLDLTQPSVGMFFIMILPQVYQEMVLLNGRGN